MHAQVLPVDPGQASGEICEGNCALGPTSRIMEESVLTTCVPIGAICFDLSPQTLLHIGEGIVVGLEHFPQQGYVGYGQAQSVDLAQTLLVRKSGHMHPQLIKGGINATARRKKGENCGRLVSKKSRTFFGARMCKMEKTIWCTQLVRTSGCVSSPAHWPLVAAFCSSRLHWFLPQDHIQD